MLNDDQINSTSRVLVGYAITYAVGKGWVEPANSGALLSALMALIVAGVHVAYIFYTQTAAKKQAAALVTVAAIPRTIVVTKPEIADATPSLPNVVSNADMKVVTTAPAKP